MSNIEKSKATGLINLDSIRKVTETEPYSLRWAIEELGDLLNQDKYEFVMDSTRQATLKILADATDKELMDLATQESLGLRTMQDSQLKPQVILDKDSYIKIFEQYATLRSKAQKLYPKEIPPGQVN